MTTLPQQPRPLYSYYYSSQPSSNRIRELSVQQLGEIRETFQIFDAGKKGFLRRDDLKCALISLIGIKPTKVAIPFLIV
jgi:Ca2+-binding EF-hand superfamily protein